MDYELEDFVPMSDRILVLQEEAEEKTSGGIIIPEDAKEKPLFGTVVAKGPGTYHGDLLVPIDLEIGQRIAFNAYAGKNFKLMGKTYSLMRLPDVEGKFNRK